MVRASAPLPRPRLILLLRVRAAGPRGLIQFEWESRPDLARLGAEGLAACEHKDKDRFWNLTPRGVELLQQIPEPVLLRAEGERLASDLRQIAQRLEKALRDKTDCPERANLEALNDLGAVARHHAPLKERCSELRRAARGVGAAMLTRALTALLLALVLGSTLAGAEKRRGRLGPQTGSSSATSASPKHGRPALRALGTDPACMRCHRQAGGPRP